MASNSIKARLAALQAIAAQKRSGVAVILPTESGFVVSRGDGKASRVYNTLSEAQSFYAACKTVIIIDV